MEEKDHDGKESERRTVLKIEEWKELMEAEPREEFKEQQLSI